MVFTRCDDPSPIHPLKRSQKVKIRKEEQKNQTKKDCKGNRLQLSDCHKRLQNLFRRNT